MKKTRRFATLFLCAVITTVFFTGCSNIADFIRRNGDDRNDPQSYTININRTITNGTVSCNKTSARAGETVVLTANPGNGYELANITAAISNNSININGTGNTRTFIMPAQNVTVNAQFIPRTYSITIDENITHGSVTANKPRASEGETVTLTATPANGYQFSAWNVTAGENETVTVTNGTFSMPAQDVTVSATFTELPPATYSITVTGGTAWANGTSVTNATAGTTITITANSPQIGKEFDSWTSSSSGVSFADATSSQTTFTMPENSVNITATYNDIIYTITDSPASYGAVTASVLSAVYGTTITLTLEPNSGYELDTISVTRQGGGTVTLNGFGQNSGDTRWFWMPDANVTVHSTFRPATYTINNQYTYNNNSANFGLLSVESNAEYGSTVTVRATPVTCYHLESLIVNNGDVTVTGSGNTRYFTMPASHVTLTATFETTHIGTKDKPNAIGDIVFNDGTALPVSDYQGRDLTDTEKQNAIAVVAVVASFNGVPDYAITVGLKQEYLPICSNTSQGYTNTQVFSHDGDAGQTRDDICYGDGGITDYTQANYPAIYWAQNYTGFGNLEITSINNDWFIPTQQELLYVYEGKDAIMAAIDKIGSQYADSFIHENHTYYHTVTQFSNSETHICLVNLEDGNDNYGQYKDSYGPVLVIRYFQCH